MRKGWAFSILLLLTACATSDHARMVTACVAGGKPDEACECAASKSDELLEQGEIDRATVQATILYTEGKEAEAERAAGTLSYDKRFSQASLLGAATEECWR